MIAYHPPGSLDYLNPNAAKPNTYTANVPQDPAKFQGYAPQNHQRAVFDTSNPARGAKYAVQNYLANVDPNTDWAPAAAAALNQQFGQSNLFRVDHGKRLSYGDEAVDSDPTRGWGGKFNWISNGPAAAPAAGGGGGVGAPASGGAAGTSSTISDAIMRLLQRGESPVTGETVKAQFDPAAAEIESGLVRSRHESAQRRAAEGTGALGGGGGANTSDLNSLNERAGMQSAQLMSRLMEAEIERRRADVVNALQFASAGEERALRAQLAEMDNQLRAVQLSQQGQQIQNQNQQFYDSFSYNMSRDNQSDMVQQLLDILAMG